MWQRQGDNFQIREIERAGNEALFGHEITFRPRPAVKGIFEHTAQIFHGVSAGVNRQRRATSQIAEAPTVVQSHDVICMAVSEEDGVDLADVFPETLGAQIRSRIHENGGFSCCHVNRRARAPVLRVRQKLWRIVLANNGHALRRATAEE